MKNIKSLSFFALFSVFVIILLVSLSGCTDKENKEQQNFSVISENTCWSPIMSSIVGIDMTGQSSEGEFMYHWTAAGDGSSDVTFISWGNETEFEVLELGNDTRTKDSETIWWNYKGLEIESMPEKFTVIVEAVREDTGNIVFEREIIIRRKVMMFCVEN